MIIGLLGKAGSGKTTVANWLRDSYGAQKFSYAAPLKEMARRIYGLSDAQLFGTQEEKETIDPRHGKSARQLLQFLGTDVCRDVLGADVWVNAAMSSLRNGITWVCDDLRFPNEAIVIQKRGGVVVKLICPDRPSNDNGEHASEQVDNVPFNYVIESRRADNDLIERAQRLFVTILGDRR
jgi:hypothetical protein